MGTFLFAVLHLVALLFGAAALLVTIPLHLIYAVLKGRSDTAKSAAAAAQRELATQVRCPQCRELVRWDAIKCKHCAADLTPANPPPPEKSEISEGAALAIAIGAIVTVVLLAKSCS